MPHTQRTTGGTLLAAVAAVGAINALLWVLLLQTVGFLTGTTLTTTVQYTIAATTGLMLPMAAALTWHARP